ncbi:4Fe-4S binding protein [Tsukamurella sp. 8F]|uniref:4Fe-4S dicluster domain-containing protein n=1 Tax=unclassified Tsukamurella TaxID=2633480 RepID=UPI0023B9F0E8|nr:MULTISPECIES: 4Fe-4S binding protein [unclassified Tsukamurella]MDF0531691.1 4Fe-4S binding protein [Tsukamurella sp. 8J]MDF0588937.1 4Fe-4S binding protein [Tsukamurella sp. 8F]
MPYVVTAPCIGTKDASCHSACPVDAIHPSPDEAEFDSSEQVYIDPTVCIDCGACEPACPVEAIYFDGEVPTEWQSSIAANEAYFD